jgi:hypothetical protein
MKKAPYPTATVSYDANKTYNTLDLLKKATAKCVHCGSFFYGIIFSYSL